MEGKKKVAVLYKRANVDLDLLRTFAEARSSRLGVPINRGLTSFIYRINIDDGGSAEGHLKAYCLKRVCIEDEVRPHSVEREILCYRRIQEEIESDSDEVPIMTLLAAFRDESDPFSVEVDLIMPLLTTTLEEVMNESTMSFVIEDSPQQQSSSRLSLLVANAVHARNNLSSFITSAVYSLFSALDFLHKRQIAHRDVKPSNILIDLQTLSIKLVDFGTCYLLNFAPGDDGKGGVTSEVGTGAYRAPESLFSPTKGYDGSKLDIWQAGVTSIQFFLPLKKVIKADTTGRMSATEEDFAEYDQREDWEKALWADDDGLAWTKLQSALQPAFRDELNERNDDDLEETASGWTRDTLFDASRGDIGLASSHFDLRGLPTSIEEWPEAEHFQPNLQKMPFQPRQASSEGLHERLVDRIPKGMSQIISVLDQCIQLSASKRISAETALKYLPLPPHSQA